LVLLVEPYHSSLVMLTLWNILVQIFLVLNTTEINTNGRADSQLLGLHETPLESVPTCWDSRGRLGAGVGACSGVESLLGFAFGYPGTLARSPNQSIRFLI